MNFLSKLNFPLWFAVSSFLAIVTPLPLSSSGPENQKPLLVSEHRPESPTKISIATQVPVKTSSALKTEHPAKEKKKASIKPLKEDKTQAKPAPDLPAVRASSEEEIILADARKVSGEEMGEMRAGFIDPTGLIFRFAVDVKAQIDGALTFVRSLVLQPDAMGQMQAATTSQVITQNLPEGTSAEVVDNGAGVVVSGENGATTILNQPSSGSIANVIVNSADNRTVSQVMNIDLVLQNVNTSIAQMTAMKSFNAPNGLFQASRMHMIGLGF